MRSLVAALLLLTLACDSRAERCERAGGQWIAYDCRVVERRSCPMLDAGNGFQMPICHTDLVTSCRHQCTAAESER